MSCIGVNVTFVVSFYCYDLKAIDLCGGIMKYVSC